MAAENMWRPDREGPGGAGPPDGLRARDEAGLQAVGVIPASRRAA